MFEGRAKDLVITASFENKNKAFIHRPSHGIWQFPVYIGIANN